MTGHRGWYVTRRLGSDSFEDDGNIIAWGPSRSGEPQTFPKRLHVPYNTSKGYVPGITIGSYVAFLEGEVADSRIVVEQMCNAMIAHEAGDDYNMQVAFETAHHESATLRELIEAAKRA